MRIKAIDADFKAVDGAEGTFTALVAAFGNTDRAGDRIVRGAFADSLRKWRESGRPIPVVWSHRWNDLGAHIGQVLEVKETDQGLWVQAQLDMADRSAAKVFKLLQRRTLSGMSFAYDVVDQKRQNGANELLKLDLIEVGPTLRGENEAAKLISTKNGGVRTGVAELRVARYLPSAFTAQIAAELLALR
jgi:HK97 family phage prohead protease